MCLEQGANDLHNGPADATATPTISCFIKIQNGLTFLVPAYPGCPGKETIKWVSLCLMLKEAGIFNDTVIMGISVTTCKS